MVIIYLPYQQQRKNVYAIAAKAKTVKRKFIVASGQKFVGCQFPFVFRNKFYKTFYVHNLLRHYDNTYNDFTYKDFC